MVVLIGPIRREVRWSTIVLFLVVQTILLSLLVVYRMEVLVPIAQATGWLVQTDLIAGGVLLLVVVGGIILRHGGLRPSDVGLIRAHLLPAVVVTVAFWLITQVALILASLLHTGTLELHPYLQNPGTFMMLTFLVAMLFGVPLYEEVAFRGFLFPQLYWKFGGSHRVRILTAAVVSAVLFSLAHVPTRLLNSGMTGGDLLSNLAILTMAGLIGVILYLRTENLLVVTGIHALVNAPTQLVTSPISPFVMTAMFSVVLWLIWPRLMTLFSDRQQRRKPVIV